MDLSFRIQTEAGSEPVVSLDGAWGAPGLNLSHWPGNTTPRELKHDLSTGIALAFARLPAAEQARLVEGCVAIANNHFDTDGVCALLAVARPNEALPREAALLAAAEAGDFFRFPSEDAFVVDAIVSGLVDPERSPWRARFAGLSDAQRYELCTLETLERLPAILDGDVAEYTELWRPALQRARADRADLATCARDELVHFDFVFWMAPPASDPGAPPFDPGRHALFGTSDADRVLVAGPSSGGTTYRFLLGTSSWFDLVTRTAQPRPSLAELASELNRLEGAEAGADVAWRHQQIEGASPELWFGTADLPQFAEHAAACLRPSDLDPARVKAIIVDGLRSTWVFPEEEEAGAPG